jgi:putative ABC transport system ATP-binding protein
MNAPTDATPPDATPTGAAPTRPASPPTGSTDAPVVHLAGIRKSYVEAGRTHTVLDGVEVRIRKGEFVVLLGPSGSGKSTLLNLVAGIDLPDEGSVRIAGNELAALDERARTLFRRAHLGFVFQFFNLLPTLTVEENLLLPIELKGRVDDDSRARARRLLERVGLADRGDSFPDRLSGGEQQRIALCRALVHEPDLILADEPTGNLDPETGETILDLLEELVRADGRTLLAVTHSRTLAARADRVLRIEGGKVVEAQ